MAESRAEETGAMDSGVKGEAAPAVAAARASDAGACGVDASAGAAPAPKVSVVVPAYNVERYLRPCLDSVLAQTLADIEVVCVNDGSTDATLDIMRAYAERDARVRIVDKPNAGYGAGVNDGFAAAKGEYVAILEADDLVEPAMYETYWRAACEHGKPDLVRGNWFKFMGEGARQKRILRQPTKVKAWYGRVFDPSRDPQALRLLSINQPGIYRRAFIVESGIRLNESPGAAYQDNGLFFQLMCLARSCYLLEERLYLLRRDNPDSSFYSKDKVFALCGEYDFIRAFIQNRPELADDRLARLEMCAVQRFHNYQWTMNRIDPELRPLFAERFHDDFVALEAAGELNRERFTPDECNELRTVLYSGHLYFLSYRQTDALRKERRERGRLRDGKEYRVGRKLLKLPRLLLGRPEGGPALPPPAVKPFEFVRPAGFVGAPIDWRLVPADIPERVRSWYAAHTRDELGFDDARSYNQKIQWLKLFDAQPVKTLLADKYLARGWVAERIGEEHLIPLLGAFDAASEIDFAALPDAFVLKTNHGCGGVYVVRDKAGCDVEAVKKGLDESLSKNFLLRWGYEIQYMNIPPKIVAEANIATGQGMLAEYKVNCFGGKPHSIWCTTGISDDGPHSRNSYDLDWNLLPEVASWPNLEQPVERPANLDELLDMASRLSQGFAHVRVDLFDVDGHIYFGEMTFTSGGGTVKFDPPEANWAYGRLIELPEERDTALLEQIAAWRAEALGL